MLVEGPASRPSGLTTNHVGTAALGRPSRANRGPRQARFWLDGVEKLGSALRRRQFVSFSSAYHSERTSSSVSSEMIASTSHSANSRMLLARFTVQTMILFPAA